jgi:hypothetical protein
MRSGHLGRGRAWLVWMMLCCAGICGTRVRAQSAVVYAGITDAELLARIRGQTRDLPIALVPTTGAALSQQLSAAQLQSIAREQRADFVVSVSEEASGAHSVYVFDARTEEVRVRAAPAPDRKHRFARSAAAETIALIVRGELSDALAARVSEAARAADTPSTADTTRTDVPATRADSASTPRADSTARADAAAPRDAAARPRTEAPRAPDIEPEEESEEEPEDASDQQGAAAAWLVPTQLSLELAGRVSTAISDRYFLGAALSLRVTFGYISLGVTGSTSLANRAHIQGLTLTLREHGIAVEALAHLPLPHALQLSLGASGRWLFYARDAASGDPAWRPEPANTSITFAVGPQVELRWQVAPHFGAGVRIGLDVLLRPVSWLYRLDTNMRGPVELERQNRVEPWLSVGVFGSL